MYEGISRSNRGSLSCEETLGAVARAQSQCVEVRKGKSPLYVVGWKGSRKRCSRGKHDRPEVVI